MKKRIRQCLAGVLSLAMAATLFTAQPAQAENANLQGQRQWQEAQGQQERQETQEAQPMQDQQETQGQQEAQGQQDQQETLAALEDQDGVESYGATLVDDGSGGKMIQVENDLWNNQNKGHAEIKDAQSLFAREAFTLLVNLKNTETAAGEWDKRGLISIGTETNALHLFTASGKVGYGDSKAGGGISANQAALSKQLSAVWSFAAVVYQETAGGNGAVTVYLDGEKAAEIPDVGFQMSSLPGIKAMLGRSFSTNFLMGGVFDNIAVAGKAMTAEEVAAEDSRRGLAGAVIQEVKDSLEEEIILKEDTVALPDYDGMVAWKSNMSQVAIGEDGRTASVTRPAAGQEAIRGELVAVISVRGQTEEVAIPAVIKPEAGENDDYGYLMVHFIEDSKGYAEKIYLDISRGDNPEQWDPLNGGAPILASHLGTTGVRDPYLTYNPETGMYYIIATDLRVFGGDEAGWAAWRQNYSTKMNVWESKDLITWSEVRQLDVVLGKDGRKQANLGMMWAPEATWVPDYYGEGKGAFVVYWSSRVYEDEAQATVKELYNIVWAATTDFTQETWEYGGTFLSAAEMGGKNGGIDTTILQNGGKTYHITKSYAENGIIMESTTDKEWWKTGAEWTRIQGAIGRSRFGDVEGPAVFKDHSNENRWYLFVDDLPSPGYQPMVSTDLDKGWEYLDSKDYFLTENTKHGGVISLTKKQYDAIRRADAISLAEGQPDAISVKAGVSEEEIINALPVAAKVNLAYQMGIGELPIDWDLSGVKAGEAGTYQAVGTVRSIGANHNQWAGKDGSADYRAEGKVPYSSEALQLTVDVQVGSGQEEPGMDALAYFDFEEEAQGQKFISNVCWNPTMTRQWLSPSTLQEARKPLPI